MTCYLSSPRNQAQAAALDGMPVLLSYGVYAPFVEKGYLESFDRILIDSGAFSQLNTGKVIDPQVYADWAVRWDGHADAVAGLDDIAGDWEKGLRNCELMPDGMGFPTFHDSDPWEALPAVMEVAKARGGWMGIGLMPLRELDSRGGREEWIRTVLNQVPDDIHVHGWALRKYAKIRRIDSFDSTGWFRDALDFRVKMAPWLNYSECLDIVVKRYKRETRKLEEPSSQLGLFDES